jgi:hypothetical protein
MPDKILQTIHDCAFTPTLALRFKERTVNQGAYNQILPPALQQAWTCRFCGKTEWKSVRTVQEGEDDA